ncbi:MAG: spermidine/putrescine ABC transporter substrate-binding protein [Marinisporobacter sp.]|nr:spermidine/putrescine ABC transporter substrate-binding protein [Marinisporobacter sp.]
MRKTLLLLLLCIFTVSGLFTGCGEKVNEQGYYSKLNVYNWGEYIDPQVLEDFEKEYGIKVYYETYAGNEEMLTKVQAGGTDYDVIFPSDYMIQAMVKEGLLQELDFNNLSNFKNVGEEFKNLPYDKNNQYSVPYLWGTIGILYDTTKIKEEIDSWNVMWDEKYKGDIVMFDSVRDNIGVALKKLGYSMNTKDIDELEAAKKELLKQKPLVKAYDSDAYKDMMASGEAAMSMCFLGDAMVLMEENPNLKYVLPKEGTNLWFDTMAVPVTSKHKKEAELFINYMMRPEVAAKCAEFVMYATPNKEGVKILPKEIRENEMIYPKGNIFEKGEVFIDLGEFTTEYDRLWTEVKAY